jgi:hypothetical protein
MKASFPQSVERLSTTLASAVYDPDGMILRLSFRDGAVYQYFQIPAGLDQNFLLADSHGRFFNHQIRGHFPHSRVLPTR